MRSYRAVAVCVLGLQGAPCITWGQGQAVSPPATQPTHAAPPAAPAKGLMPGDTAPPIKIANWVRGDAVKSFEKDKVYVIEFWATWCGPCIQNIPKLTALQAKHKDAGLVVIGVSSADPQGIEAVRPFVERMGDKMNYTVAVDDAFATSKAYMSAVNQNSIPFAFVVDKAGKVAWYGHPANNMEFVVGEVVKGSFDAKTYVDPQVRMSELSGQVATAGASKDWAAADTAFAEMKKLRPDFANNFDLWRFNFLYATRKDVPMAMAYAEEILKGPVNDDPMALTGFYGTVTTDPKPSPEALALALKTMIRSVELSGRKDARLLSILADSQSLSGQHDEAIKTIDEAMAVAADTGTRKALELKRGGYADAKAAKASATPPATPAPSSDQQLPKP